MGGRRFTSALLGAAHRSLTLRSAPPANAAKSLFSSPVSKPPMFILITNDDTLTSSIYSKMSALKSAAKGGCKTRVTCARRPALPCAQGVARCHCRRCPQAHACMQGLC